jgi:hypothetical protein
MFFVCKSCGIRFSNRNTLNAHRQHYCIKHETTKSHSTGDKNYLIFYRIKVINCHKIK